MKVKILSFLALALSFAGCTGTGRGTSGGGSLPSIQTSSIPNTAGEKLPKEPIVLTSAAVTRILDELSADLKNGKTRSTATSNNLTSLDSYVGEFLYIPIKETEDKFRVSNSPRSSVYELTKANTNLRFRSLYEGNFVVDVSGEGTARKITISNKVKYEFSENDLYQVIAQDYNNRNFNALKDGVQLHKLAFPDNSRAKTASLMLMEVAGANRDTRTVKNEYDFIQKNSSFTAQDRVVVASALANARVNDVNLDRVLTTYSFTEKDTNTEIANLILSKNVAERHEIEFLQRVFHDVPDRNLSNYIGNWYVKNGNPALGNQYLTGNLSGVSSGELASLTPGTTDPLRQVAEQNYASFRENFQNGESNLRSGNYARARELFQAALALNRNYDESGRLHFYIGQTNYNTGNYSAALESYRTAANVEKTADRQAEIYYNMGLASHELGNTTDTRNYLTYVTQRFPSSEWSQRSINYLATLN